MRIIAGLTIFLLCICLMVVSYRKDKDFFSPIFFFCGMTIIRYVPGLLFIDTNLGISMNDHRAFLVMFYEAIFIVSVTLGYMLFKRKQSNKINRTIIDYQGYIPNKVCPILLYIIGFAFGIFYIYRIGGISHLINDGKDIGSGNGNGYVRALMFLMIVGIGLFMQRYYSKKIKVHPFIFYTIISVLFIGYSLFFVIQTSRSPILEGLMILLMIYNYQKKKINLSFFLKPATLFVILLAAGFIVLMPHIRGLDSFSSIKSENVLEYLSENIIKIFDEFCYTTRDAFVYEKYNSDNFWYGANVVNLLCAPLPSSLFPWKPPVDDGIYLANAVLGYFVVPPSSSLPWYNSYPFSSAGGLYVNFGVFGLVIGGILIGALYNKVYELLKRNRFDLFNIVLYQLVAYQLEISSLSIVQTLTPLVVTYISLRIVCGRKVFRNIYEKCRYSSNKSFADFY